MTRETGSIQSAPTLKSVVDKAQKVGMSFEDFVTRVIEMVRDKEDRYGIGCMTSQWQAEEVADDIIERLDKELM